MIVHANERVAMMMCVGASIRLVDLRKPNSFRHLMVDVLVYLIAQIGLGDESGQIVWYGVVVSDLSVICLS